MANYTTEEARLAAEAIIRELVNRQHIEVTNKAEAIKDVTSVFTSYKSTVQNISRLAQETIAQNGVGRDSFFQTKHQLAKQYNVILGSGATEHLIKQVISLMLQSRFVDEVYSDDHILQRNMRPFIYKLFDGNKKIEDKIKKQLRHVDVNTEKWKIEYQRLKEKIDFRNK